MAKFARVGHLSTGHKIQIEKLELSERQDNPPAPSGSPNS